MKTISGSAQLRLLLSQKPLIRVMEAHNGLSGYIAENAKAITSNSYLEFDGLWSSSLTDSLSKGKPDNAVVDITSRMLSIQQILEVTHKPLLVDANDGGFVEHFVYTVRALEKLNAAAVFIEDKVGLKENSLNSTINQKQDSIINFAKKITAGKQAKETEDFMIFARIESLILGEGLKGALLRAEAYIAAGADGILIHSKDKSAAKILKFAKEYQHFDHKVPLAVVPTVYNQVAESTLQKVGVNIVIYANHLLRSAYKTMEKTAISILNSGRAFEAEEYCIPISDFLRIIK